MIAAVPVFTWTGFYVGVNAGYGWNTNDNNNYFDPVFGSSAAAVATAASSAVARSATTTRSASSSSVSRRTSSTPTSAAAAATFGQGFLGDDSNDGHWFGTVRARAGFAFDRALVYATGGFAYGDIGTRRSVYHRRSRQRAIYGNDNGTNTGWVLGGGVEYAFTNNLTAKVEGLYVNLDSKNDNFRRLSSATTSNDRVRRGSRWPELQVQQLLRAVYVSTKKPGGNTGLFLLSGLYGRLAEHRHPGLEIRQPGDEPRMSCAPAPAHPQIEIAERAGLRDVTHMDASPSAR